MGNTVFFRKPDKPCCIVAGFKGVGKKVFVEKLLNKSSVR